MPSIDRRRFLQGAAGAATAVAVGGPFQGFTAMPANANGRDGNTLRAIPDLRDGKVRLWLPEEFQYRSFHDTDLAAGSFVTLDDGTRLPGRHDGMGAFPLATVTSCSSATMRSTDPARLRPRNAVRHPAGSGTTSVEVTLHGEVVRSFTSLNGTQMNCSGGIMPWGSWITCEETVNGPDVGPDFTGASNITLEKRHGFIFEVPAGGQSNRQPVTAAGRFAHEAVAFDPRDGILYLTEDNFGFPSGFYRYVPSSQPDENRHAGQRRAAADAGGRRAAQHPLGGSPVAGTTYDVRVGRHRRSEPDLPVHAGAAGPHDEQRRDRLRRQPGAGAGRRALLEARRRGV